jgi:hypothetical protein
MQLGTLCVPKRTQSVRGGVTTQSVGTIEFGSIIQVGVDRQNTAVSPLSLRERARVRAF